jgi:glucokinase
MATRRTRQNGLTDQGALEQRILSLLRGLDPDDSINQRQLAMRLGVLTSTAHYAVARLIQRDFIEQVATSGRAKPIRLKADRVLAAGLAADQGEIRLAVLNLREEIVAERSGPLPDKTHLPVGDFATLAQTIIGEAISSAGGDPRHLAAACVAINGLVDESTGMVIEWSTFGWQDAPLASALANRLSCPVKVLGTASLSEAISEAVGGVGRGFASMLYFRVGDGISARLVQNGQLFGGEFGYAGELGHIPVARTSAPVPCGVCGSPYCLEAHASGTVLAAQYADQAGLSRAEQTAPRLFATLVSQAEAGDRTAKRILDKAIDLWAAGLQIALNAYDPPVLALGGWCLRGHPWLAKELSRRVRRQLFESARRPVHIAPAIVEPARRDLAAAAAAMHVLLGDAKPSSPGATGKAPQRADQAAPSDSAETG